MDPVGPLDMSMARHDGKETSMVTLEDHAGTIRVLMGPKACFIDLLYDRC